MKSLNYFAYACMLGAALSGFTACSEDDDSENSGNGGGNTSEEVVNGTTVGGGTTATTTPVVSNPVLTIGNEYDDWCTFNYVNGRLTSIQDNDDDMTITFTQSPLTINSVWYADANNYEKTNYTNVLVNADGYITAVNFKVEGKESYNNGSDQEEWSSSGTLKAGYDAEGHLIKLVTEANFSEDGNTEIEKETVTYTWNDGNLVRSEEVLTETDEDGVSSATSVYTYTYDSYQPNSGVYFDDNCEYIEEYLYYSGLFGKASRLIPTAYTEKLVEGTYNYNHNYTLSASYNVDGTISCLTHTNTSYSYSNKTYFGYANYPIQRTQQYSNAVKSMVKKAVKRHRSRK